MVETILNLIRLLVAVVLVDISACSVAEPDPTDPGAPPVVQLTRLDGATTPTRFQLEVDVPGATSAKLVTDGAFAGEVDDAPLRFAMELTPGQHDVRVRAEVDDETQRFDATFTVFGTGGPTSTTAPATTSTTGPVPVPTTLPGDGGGTVARNPAEISAAIQAAGPGAVILVADGEHRFDDRLVAAASGTATEPITLRGSRNAVIRTKNASGDYGLHITGDHWRIEGLTIAHATKGIVLDGSVGTVIDGVEIFDIGDEAVHFRTCSSDGVLRNSFIHDTGRNSAQYGEGVYVGSANSNWDKYECTDAEEGDPTGDNTERVLIEDNVFEDITAEGADLKEGTDSGIIRRNVFRRVGISGQNSADSAIDAKGNGWVIEDNVVSETDAEWDDDGVMRPSEFADGYQSHSVHDGYGTGNTFRRNRVEGAIPGFGIGLYPGLENVVTCDNEAPGAALGLVGDKSRPSSCD